ncbi:unnamed protein product [Caenorhabditis angaria]|uniref:Uncharacterized protein n=1 Tax=Caenorhabditis angaria TaxID=860376 RepID=A0A9P1IGZ6_9PELO|nr:unnamed protein product [Caenorhabditis angaria]
MSEEDCPKLKKQRIEECINYVSNQESDVNNILNLINFGSYNSNDSQKVASDERENRKERGDRLLQLYYEQPALSNSASARRFEKNHERAVIWEEITNKINEEFGEKLEVLTVDKVKKLLTYYKKKDEGNLEKPTNKEVVVKLEDVPEPTELLKDVDQPLANLLSIISSKTSTPSSSSGFLPLLIVPQTSSDSSESASSSSSSNNEQLYILKKERHDFVVKLAEHYIQRMCFDNSSRSATVNAERHNMWIKITQQTNDKYSKVLGNLGVEQSKKLYSNCKRRRKLKEFEQPSCSLANSPDPEDFPSENTSTMELLDTLMIGMSKDAEILQLKNELSAKNAEISALKILLAEEREKRKSEYLRIIEEFRQKVDDVTNL